MLAVIGGSGLGSLRGEVRGLEIETIDAIRTPYGGPVQVDIYYKNKVRIAFMPRHAAGDRVPAHKVNYRSNIWALHSLGVDRIIATNTVGGISEDLAPGAMAIPEQLIDYTWGRENTFFDGADGEAKHIDFTWPYDGSLREALREAAVRVEKTVRFGGVYGVLQGPRLETAAEILRLRRDGCDMVGMTSMPEATLAREMGIRYACLALSVNWAAGLGEGEISMKDIRRVHGFGTVELIGIIEALIEAEERAGAG